MPGETTMPSGARLKGIPANIAWRRRLRLKAFDAKSTPRREGEPALAMLTYTRILQESSRRKKQQKHDKSRHEPSRQGRFVLKSCSQLLLRIRVREPGRPALRRPGPAGHKRRTACEASRFWSSPWLRPAAQNLLGRSKAKAGEKQSLQLAFQP